MAMKTSHGMKSSKVQERVVSVNFDNAKESVASRIACTDEPYIGVYAVWS